MDSRDRARDLLSLPSTTAQPAIAPSAPKVAGYNTATGQHDFVSSTGAISQAKVKASGGVSPGQPLLASGAVAIAKNTVPLERRRRRPPRTLVGDFKILLRKIIPGAHEYWLGGDREPVLIATIPVPANPPTTILNAVVANLGRGEDDWVVQIRIKQTVNPPVFPGGAIYTLNSYDPTGLVKSVSYAVVGPGQGNLAYVGHGFWSSVQRKVFTYEVLYSGITATSTYACIPPSNPYVAPEIEYLQTITIDEDHILIAFDEGGVGPRTYADRKTVINNKIVYRLGNYDFTQVCGEDFLNTYIDLEANIKHNKSYFDQSINTIASYRELVSFEELNRTVTNYPLYEDFAAIPYNRVVTTVPVVDDTRYTIIDVTETQNDSLKIAVASSLSVDDIRKQNRALHIENNTTVVLNYSFEEIKNSPFLAGENSAIYKEYKYKASGVPAVTEVDETKTKWVVKTINENGETLSTGLAPSTLKQIEDKQQHINLIGPKMYIATPSDFNGQTANQDFESTVEVQDIRTGVVEAKTGVVLNLGSPSEFTIVSMQYYPEDE